MDETINKEPVVGESGAKEEPTSKASDTRAEPSAVDGESLKDILGPMVQAEVERRTQSIKDKRIARQESRISELEDTLARIKELKDEGMSEKQAIQYIKFQEFLEGQSQVQSEALPMEEKATQPSVAADSLLSSALNQTGLSANDAEVIEIIRRNPGDSVKQILEVSQLAERRKQVQSQPPNPAATLPTGGGQTVEGETLETVTAELQAELAKATKNPKRLRELRLKQESLLPKG